MCDRFLYFDVGNVLLSFSQQQMCRQMAQVAGIEPQQVQQFLASSADGEDLQRQFETGQVEPDEFYDRFCEMAGSRPHRQALQHAACDIFEPIDTMMALAEQLAAAGQPLGLLSNSNALHWAFFTDGRFPLLAAPASNGSPFSVAIASHEVGAVKPDAAIFRTAIQRAEVPAGRIMFVDDRPENVAAARAAGIDAVQFINVGDTSRQLAERGIL